MTVPPQAHSRPGQLALELGHQPSHAEDDYIVGEGNRLAYAHVLAYPDWPGPLTLILGPAGAGKSHLARIWAERAGAALVEPRSAEARASSNDSAPLVAEDVDRAGYAEAALFHLLNQSMRTQRPLLLTARAPVEEWPFITQDLKSRARLAARFTLELSGDIQLSQMFVKLFQDRQVTVEPKVVAYIVARMERLPQEAVELADLMDRLALERGSAITRTVAAEALARRSALRDDAQMTLDLAAHPHGAEQ